MRHNSPFSFRTRLVAELRLAYPAYSMPLLWGIHVEPGFQSLDVTCGDELANEVANELVIANLWQG